MKKYIIVIMLILIGCNPYSQSQLLGTWQMIGEYCNEKGENCSNTNINGKWTREYFKNGNMLHKIYDTNDGYPIDVHETWKYKLDGKEILVVDDKGKISIEQVIILNDKTLVINRRQNEKDYIYRFVKIL